MNVRGGRGVRGGLSRGRGGRGRGRGGGWVEEMGARGEPSGSSIGVLTPGNYFFQVSADWYLAQLKLTVR